MARTMLAILWLASAATFAHSSVLLAQLQEEGQGIFSSRNCRHMFCSATQTPPGHPHCTMASTPPKPDDSVCYHDNTAEIRTCISLGLLQCNCVWEVYGNPACTGMCGNDIQVCASLFVRCLYTAGPGCGSP